MHGRTVELGGALVNLSIVHALRGETARARTLLVDCRRPPRARAARAGLARAYAQMARRHTLAERWEETLTWSRRARLAERLGIGRSPRWPSSTEEAQVAFGDIRGLDDMHEALRTSRGLGLGLETVRAVANLGTALWLTDGPAQGLELEQTGIDLGERRGVTSMVVLGKAFSMWGAVRSWTLGRRRASRGRGDCVGQQARRQLPRSDGTQRRARTVALRGHMDEASALSAEALPRARTVQDPKSSLRLSSWPR